MMLKIETLPQLLRRHADATPERLSQRHKQRGIWVAYSWADVTQRVLGIAAALRDDGLKRNDAVLIVGDNEPAHVWTELAVQARSEDVWIVLKTDVSL